MTVRIREASRLQYARLAVLDGVEHWELPEYPTIEESNDDLRHDVDRNDRIDNLAQRYYGSPELWWVIAIANGMELLPNDLKPGTRIRIPSGKRVFSKILRTNRRNTEG